ncbi:DUF3224 domain-containing protein [Pseudalkalibacillus sp. Hm43]|uniref:DUF3224 domain-containing protein n=1 Tax=Pseudalkalibacillus sp. Hm43 TaxID=3450742 RepID=UPI003F43F5BA
MEGQASSIIKIKRGSEIPYSDIKGGPKLTKSHFEMSYEGDLRGEGILEELKCYFTETAATVYGLERFTGNIGERIGSFVIEHNGTFENGVLSSTQKVIPQSGTGDLKGIEGVFDVESTQSDAFSITFNYSFDEEMATFLKEKEEEEDKYIEEEIIIADQWLDACNALEIEALLEITSPTIEISGPRGSGFGKGLLVDWLERTGLKLETLSIYGRKGVLVYEQHAKWSGQEGRTAGEANAASVLKVKDGKVAFIARFDSLEKALKEAGIQESDKVL